jgi:NAD(P)H-flavin reductase
LELNRRKSISSVVLDGPYGKALRLEDFKIVILIARGIGIMGILPHLRHMTYRSLSKAKEHARYRRGLITRKIDVYWVLEDEDQMAWV